MEKVLFDKKTAAALLSLSIRSLDNLVRAKELMPRRVGKRVLFEPSELERFAKRDHRTQLVGGEDGIE